MLELMLSSVILAMVMAVTFSVFRDGLFAWKRATAEASILQDLNAAVGQLSRWIERSPAESLSVTTAGDAIAGVDSIRDDGTVGYDPSGQVVWERYRIAYLDAAENLRLRSLPLPTGAPERNSPGPIELFNGGGGPAALSTYLTGGNMLASHIVLCRFTLDGARVQVELTAERPRFRSSKPERVRLQTSVIARN